MYTRLVTDSRTQAIQGVYFPHQMPLSDATKGRVTGHLTDRVHAVCEQQSPRATASGGGGRLGPRVPPSDHYHIKARAARGRAVAAEATQRQASAEGRRGPAATVSEKEHAEREDTSARND